MSKSREQRISEGWTERWGAYLKTGDGTPCWWTGLSALGGRTWERADKLTGPRHAFKDLHDAMRWCLDIPSQNVTARRYWRRQRPKPAPELKVGDEGVVRVVLDEGTASGDGSKGNCWISSDVGSTHRAVFGFIEDNVGKRIRLVGEVLGVA